jgi:predicted small lipoprotein YifL
MLRLLRSLSPLFLVLILGACGQSKGPLWTPDSPRNGATQPVDPVYGTPIPGYPSVGGPS